MNEFLLKVQPKAQLKHLIKRIWNFIYSSFTLFAVYYANKLLIFERVPLYKKNNTFKILFCQYFTHKIIHESK